MQRRKLGATDLELPVIVFGAMAFGAQREASSDGVRIATMQAAIDAGITAIDTAPLYEFGRSEELVGRAIRDRRDRVEVLTKVGLRWDTPHGDVLFEFTDSQGVRRQCRKCSRPESVRWEVEQSLSRLSVEVIDLVQVHHPDRHTPIAETMGALLDLRREGKVRHIGVSNYTPAQLREARRALGDVPLASDQAEYSLVKRDAERWLLPHTRAEGVPVLAYSPLEQGLLSGRVTEASAKKDTRADKPTFQRVNLRAVNAVIDRVLRPIAAGHSATVAQVVLAWTVAQPGIAAAITGASSPEQARENAGAGALVLGDQDLREIRAGFEALGLVAVTPGGGKRARLVRLARRILEKLQRRA